MWSASKEPANPYDCHEILYVIFDMEILNIVETLKSIFFKDYYSWTYFSLSEGSKVNGGCKIIRT